MSYQNNLSNNLKHMFGNRQNNYINNKTDLYKNSNNQLKNLNDPNVKIEPLNEENVKEVKKILNLNNEIKYKLNKEDSKILNYLLECEDNATSFYKSLLKNCKNNEQKFYIKSIIENTESIKNIYNEIYIINNKKSFNFKNKDNDFALDIKNAKQTALQEEVEILIKLNKFYEITKNNLLICVFNYKIINFNILSQL